MPKPHVSTPIPPAARPIVERVHRRFVAACRAGRRPALDGRNQSGLLTALEIITLAQCGYYPIPPKVISLGCTANEHSMQVVLDQVRGEVAEAILEATAR